MSTPDAPWSSTPCTEEAFGIDRSYRRVDLVDQAESRPLSVSFEPLRNSQAATREQTTQDTSFNTNVGSNSVICMLEAQAHHIVRALKYMRRRRKPYVAVRPEAMADFIAKIDRWMDGTVWLTRCNNYFRAANGRVVTQWPRSARVFWGMTRRFKAADYTFDSPSNAQPVAAPPRAAAHHRLRR